MDLISAVSILKKEIHKEKQEYILQNSKSVNITQNGQTEVTPATGNDAMKKVVVTTAVPVPMLEDNRIITITENGTVEITPSVGKDGMKKVTATVNVASGGIFNWHVWSTSNAEYAGDDTFHYFNFSTAPSSLQDSLILYITRGDIARTTPASEYFSDYSFNKVSDNEFQLLDSDGVVSSTFYRNSWLESYDLYCPNHDA